MKTRELTLIFSLLIATGCVAMKPLEPVNHRKGANVLYVVREDAPLSMNHKVKIYLNNRKATEILQYDGYKALILRPGTYTIKFIVFNKGNKKIKVHSFTDTIKPETKSYMCTFAYNFGWRGWKTFFNAEGKSIMTRYKFRGQVDLTNKISPQ